MARLLAVGLVLGLVGCAGDASSRDTDDAGPLGGAVQDEDAGAPIVVMQPDGSTCTLDSFDDLTCAEDE